MEKLKTAGETAFYTVAAHWLLFVLGAAALALGLDYAGVKVPYPKAFIFAVLAFAVSCKCLWQTLRIEDMHNVINKMAGDIEDLEQQLKFEKLSQVSPVSCEELSKLDCGADSEPIRVQLARIRAEEDARAIKKA